MTLAPQPQVIFKTYPSQMGYDPLELQQKTGIPVVVLNYGNFTILRPELYKSIRIMGTVLGKEERAEQVISFFEKTIADLEQRTADIPAEQWPAVFLSDVAFKRPQLLLLDEPTSSLDLRNQITILSVIRKIVDNHQIAAVMTMHDLNNALRYADRYCFLKGGIVHAACDRSTITADIIE